MKKLNRDSPAGKVMAEGLIKFLMRDGYNHISTDLKDPNYNMEMAKLYFRQALLLARQIKPPARVIDSIIMEYIERYSEYRTLKRLFSLPSPAFVLNMTKCGATKQIIEFLAYHFAEAGRLEMFVETVKLIGRKPKPEEICLAVGHFLKRPDKSVGTRKYLLDFAHRYLPENVDLKQAIREYFD